MLIPSNLSEPGVYLYLMPVTHPPPRLGDTLECLKTKPLRMGVSYCTSVYGQMNPLRNTRGELLHVEIFFQEPLDM